MKIVDMIGAPFGFYRVVPANEAHVRIMFDKKEVFMSREFAEKQGIDTHGKPPKPSYWRIPFVTKIHKLPLTNIRIDVPDVKLNDKNMAKFLCDIVCFVNIKDPILAAERTDITITEKRYDDPAIRVLSEDFRAIMESVMRTTATKQEILGMYMDRNTLDRAVTTEVEAVFPRWGLELVDLEIKDLKDTLNSTIIADIERKVAATINADARVRVAEESKRAVIAEAEQGKLARFRSAEMEEEAKKREITKDQVVAVTQQVREQAEAEATTKANAQKVEAKRKLEVGFRDVEREKVIKDAEATKAKLETEAAGQAKKIFVEGEASAKIIKLTKVADAEGTERMAEAMKKYDNAATTIQYINANKEVGLEIAKSYQKLVENAKINIVAGSTSEIMSGGLLGTVKLGAKDGAYLGQFIDLITEKPELLKTATDALATLAKAKKD